MLTNIEVGINLKRNDKSWDLDELVYIKGLLHRSLFSLEIERLQLQ